jgi:O-antigen/teichoic acid export membrane protein
MLRQASSYMIAHGVSAVLGFAAIMVFTRLLDPEQYGLYVVGMSLAGIINAVLFAWIRLAILRFQSEGGGADIRLNAIVGYGLSAALTPIAVGVTMLTTGLDLLHVGLAMLVALTLGLFEFGQEVFKAQQKTGAYMRAAVLRAVVTFGASLALVQMGFGGASLLAGITIAYALTALVFGPRVWSRPVKKFDRALFRAMVIYGAPMAFSGTVFALHGALDRLIVVHFLGEASAGIYGASADLVRQIILFPALAIGSAMAPLVIRSLSEGGREKADAQLVQSGELLLAALLPAVAGLAIIAPSFAQFMLGPDYRDAAAVLIPVLVLAWLFQALTHQFVQLSFHLAKAPRLLLAQGCIILVVNVVATIVLVPPYGLVGAAWALVIAEGFGLLIGYWLAKAAHPLPVQPWPILRVVAATTAMAIPTYIVAQMTQAAPLLSLLAPIGVGMIAYAAAAFALNIIGIRGRLSLRPA